MRSPDSRRAAEADRRVEHRVIRRASLIDCRRVDVGLERRADLAQGLGRSVELRLLPVASADHSFDVAAGIVERHERALHTRFLLQRNPTCVAVKLGDLDVDQIAAIKKLRWRGVVSPLDLLRAKPRFIVTELDRCRHRFDIRYQPVHVAARLNISVPVNMMICRDRLATADDVLQVSLPAVAAFVCGESVAKRLLGGALHLEIQAGVDAQSGLVDLLGTILLLQVLADFFHKVRSNVVGLGLELQFQWCALGTLGFGGSDLAVFQHVVDDQVAALQRALGIVDGRIVIWRLGQARENAGFIQVEVFRFLAEVVVGAGLKAVNAVPQVDLVGVKREDLLLGEAALDLDGEHHFLHLATKVAVRREEQVARQLHGQCRGALGAALQQNVTPRCPEDTPHIYAPVLLEILVFGGDQGIAQNLREVGVAVDDAPLQRELANDAVLVVVKLGDGAGAIMFELGDLRQVGGVDEDQPADGAGECGNDDQKREEGIANQLQTETGRRWRNFCDDGRVFDNALHEWTTLRIAPKIRGLVDNPDAAIELRALRLEASAAPPRFFRDLQSSICQSLLLMSDERSTSMGRSRAARRDG